MPNMMTLFTLDAGVCVDVSTSMVTVKTDRQPADTARIVDLSPAPPFEVWIGDRYTIRVGGEVVHEFERSLDDPAPAFEQQELPDGRRRARSMDGRFSITIGPLIDGGWVAPSLYRPGRRGAVLTIVDRPLDLCMSDGESWFDLGGYRWQRDLHALPTCVATR